MPSPGRLGHTPVPSKGWDPPRFRCASSARSTHALTRPPWGHSPDALTRMELSPGAPGPAIAPPPGRQPPGRLAVVPRQELPMPSPGRCGVTPLRPHKDGPPAGVPGRLSHLPPGRDPFGPRPGSAQSQIASDPAAPSKTKSALWVGSGRLGHTRHPTHSVTPIREHLKLFLEPARFLLILCKIIPAQHWVHPLPIRIRLLQFPFKFQPLVPVPGPRPYPNLSLHHVTGLYRYALACSSALSSRLASLFGL